MTNHKRKASQELTSNSAIVLLPIPEPMSMIGVRSVFSHTWSLCKSFCMIWLPIAATYTTMTYASHEITADTHIQSCEHREDGATALKRQRTQRAKSMRSRSTIGEHRKGGRGRLEYTGCYTERDFQKRNDEFWAPPDPRLLRKSLKFNSPRTSEMSFEEEHDAQEHLRRRHSDSTISPRTPEAMSQFRSPDLSPNYALNTSTAKATRTPQPLPWAKDQHSGPSNDSGLSEWLDNLLITPKDDQKEAPVLRPSWAMERKRAELAKEREVKKREDAIRAAKELRLSRRDPLKQLVQPLSERWEQAVNDAYWENSHHRVITTAIKGTPLHRKDFQTLLGRHAWLNDEIINGYLEWIEDAANNVAIAEAKASGEVDTNVPKFIAHNSFFYETLINKGPKHTERLMKRKKVPGKSFIEVDSMFVPICKGSHWTVGVVRPVAKTIEYFDSMGGDPRPFTELMRNWLKFQLGDTYVEEEWRVPKTACARQTNGYDCGVFVCTNSFCVALGLDTSCYKERDMAQQRRNIAAVLINRGFTGDFAWGLSGW